MLKTRMEKFLAAWLASILLLHFWASLNSGYFYIWWLDDVMHFTGGFWLGALALYLLAKSGNSLDNFTSLFSFLLVLGFVSLGGVLWEFFEFGYDKFIADSRFLDPAQLGVKDTMSDLFFDLSGGALAALIFLKKGRRLL